MWSSSVGKATPSCSQGPPYTMSNVFAWSRSDSTVILSWLNGSHRQFKTFVGNRVSHIVELVPSDKWNHINGAENPADCASRGLLPSELIEYELWWRGPSWLRSDQSQWPKQTACQDSVPSEEKEVCLFTVTQQRMPIIPLD